MDNLFVCLKCVEGKVSSGFEDLVILADGQEANWEVVERILFIYAKLNPGHGYVQVSHNNNGLFVLAAKSWINTIYNKIAKCWKNLELMSNACDSSLYVIRNSHQLCYS